MARIRLHNSTTREAVTRNNVTAQSFADLCSKTCNDRTTFRRYVRRALEAAKCNWDVTERVYHVMDLPDEEGVMQIIGTIELPDTTKGPQKPVFKVVKGDKVRIP